jgi:hypothetical protein
MRYHREERKYLFMNTKKTMKAPKNAYLKGKKLTLTPFKKQAWHKIPIRDKLRRPNQIAQKANREAA